MIDYIAIILWTIVVSAVTTTFINTPPKRNHDLIFRLRMRANIRRSIVGRKSVQEGKPDRISDLLDEAANELEKITS